MSASQRRKGHSFEREIARRFREVFPDLDVKRGMQSRGGVNIPDVDAGVFHIECKIGKKPLVRAALAQAVRDHARGKWPVAIVKDDRKLPFAIMDLEDFLDLVSEWYDGRK